MLSRPYAGVKPPGYKGEIHYQCPNYQLACASFFFISATYTHRQNHSPFPPLPAAPASPVHRQPSPVTLTAPTSASAIAAMACKGASPPLSLPLGEPQASHHCHPLQGGCFRDVSADGHLLSQTQHPPSAGCGRLCVDPQCEREEQKKGA